MTTELEPTVAQGTDQPAETPAPAQESPAQALDLSAIRVSVGEGPDAEMSVLDLRQSYAESRRAMAKAQEEKATLAKRYEWADKFASDLQTNPGLRQHLESYYAGQTEDTGRGYSQMQAPTRESIELAELKTKVASFALQNNLDSLERELKDKYGTSLAPEQRAAIWEDVARTNNEDVRGLYWARFGEQLVQQATKQTTKQVAAKIAENTNAYKGPASLSPGAMQTSEPSMFSNEWNEAVLSDLKKRGG